MIRRSAWTCTLLTILQQVLLTHSGLVWNHDTYGARSYSNVRNYFPPSADINFGTPSRRPYCDCVEASLCPLALNLMKKIHKTYYEVNLLNGYTCGYDEFYPRFCCNLIVENLLIVSRYKQKRAYHSHHNHWTTNEYDVDIRNNNHFKWDSNWFPHWNNAPSGDTNKHHWNDDGCDDNYHHSKTTKKPKTTHRPKWGQNTTPTSTTTSTTPAPTTTTIPTTTAEELPIWTDPVETETPVTTEVPVVEMTLETATTREEKRNLLARTCGISLQNRIVGGETARIRDYPWMARLGYVRTGVNGLLFRCGGSLISNRHVVTAAHCVSNLPNGLSLTVVRLGELDERTDVDCNGNDCADPPQDYTPGTIVIHPNYNTPRMNNDIGLVRLNSPARFTDFVAPLCLPFTLNNMTGTSAIVAGWGSTNTGIMSSSPTLQWVRLTVMRTEECTTTYRTRYNITIGPNQLCTAGIQNMDACEGDSGGPLFLEGDQTRRATLIGIVSFGPRRCGTAALPGVYTRVESFLDWILDSL